MCKFHLLPSISLDMSGNSVLPSDVAVNTNNGDECNAIRERLSTYMHCVRKSTLTFMTTLRKRFLLQGDAMEHIGNRVPRDVATILGKYLWDTRCDTRWTSVFVVSQDKK